MKIILTMLLFISTLFADLKVGEAFPSLTLVDQFDANITINQETKTTLLLSFEKEVSKTINKFLKEQSNDFMEKQNLLYISDISSMPSFITSWIALPKMKKLPFKIALIYEEKVTDNLNQEAGKATVITLEKNQIKSIEFIEPKNLGTLFQ